MQASSWIKNHGHSDGISLSLPQHGDGFYNSVPGFICKIHVTDIFTAFFKNYKMK